MTLTPSARAGFAGTAVLAALALSSTAVASAAPAPKDAAASFITQQLKAGGDHFVTTYGGQTYDDYGLTIDGIFALAASGSAQAQLSKSAGYMVANGKAYYSGGDDIYVGSLAKQAAMVSAVGGNPRSSGGVDLIAKLQGLQKPDGRFSDKSTYGDYSNSMSQVWSIIALKRAGVAVPTAAVNFLLKQQCANGGFRLDPAAASCASDPDVTSFAVQALAAAGSSAAVTKAANYLATQQDASGGVKGGAGSAGINANSAGLASVAFTLAGKTANATRATAYVSSLQFGCDVPLALRGAIAYDKASFTKLRAAGSKAKPTDQENRNTVQASLAFSKKSYAQITAGGTQSAVSRDCAAATPTSSPTSSPSSSSSSTATATPTSSSTSSPVTGPPVVTDGPSAGQEGANPVVLVGLGGFIVAAGAGAVAYGRRR